MNTRLAIIITLIVIIIAGAWYGISQWQRSIILQGDRDVLLINKKDKAYSFLSASDLEDIDGRFKIAGYVDELSDEEIAKLTEGYTIAGSFPTGQGELPGRPTRSSELEFPEGEEVESWNAFISLLSAEQQSLCDAMPTSSLSQYCTIRHGVFEAVEAGEGAEICDSIFIETAKQECIKNIEENNERTFTDSDGNRLLDSFEIYIGKSEFFRTQSN